MRIDLYQDGPDGPALLATIAAATPDDGEFIWIPSSSGVDFGTYGLRIQVSLVNSPLVIDRSTEAFTVPEDGKTYWVDDRSNADDEFTPGAIGDNRNTGKLATAPKPNPVNLPRVYALDAGTTVYVDTGTYPMIYTLSISGSTDLGLGLDEGFLLTGPTDPARVASLFPAIPGDRSRPLILLNDADFVTIEHLTLANALRGLEVGNASDNFSASWLTAYGHAADGLRIDTSNPLATFDHLTAYNNTGRGIFIDGPIGAFTNGLAYGNSTDGIYINGAAGVVSDSVAHNNGASGIESEQPGCEREGRGERGATATPRVSRSTTMPARRRSATPTSRSGAATSPTATARPASTATATSWSSATPCATRPTSSRSASRCCTRRPSTTSSYGNYVGIESSNSGGEIRANRVYDNSGFGIRSGFYTIAEQRRLLQPGRHVPRRQQHRPEQPGLRQRPPTASSSSGAATPRS